jgi:hypothetical protein
MMCLIGLAATMVAGPTSALLGQIVRGAVSVPSAGSRADGVALLLLDSASNEHARTLSRPDGSYTLRAPAAGRYRLLARGIGFYPARTALFDLHADTTIAVALVALPAILPRVTTIERSQCRVRPDSGSAIWTLWEQTSAALLAATITLGDREKRFKIVLSSRLYMLHPLELRTVAFAETELRGTRPWQSLPPDTLALRGYVFASDSGVTYVAPDLDVLLSSAFASTHCLHIHRGSASDARLVGMDFAPAPGNHRPEIEGTFWLDGASRELRSLEFTYANLASVERDTLAGGRVQFLRLATGEWIIPDWVIRAPIAARATAIVAPPARAPGIEDLLVAPSRRPAAVRIKQGNVLAVLQSGDDHSAAVWSRATSALHVQVTAQVPGKADAPLAGAVLRLPGGVRQAVTDSAGSAVLEGLVEGEYLVEVTTPAYEALFRTPERLTLSMRRDGVIERRVHVATAEQVVESICGRMHGWPGHMSGVLAGTVTKGGAPETGAVITVEYEHEQNASRSPLGKSWVRTADKGTFIFCNVPRDVPLRLRVVTSDGKEGIQQVRLAEDQLWATTNVPAEQLTPGEGARRARLPSLP